MPNPDDNDALIRSYLASFSSGEPKRVSAHVAETFVNQHFGHLGGGCEGKAAYEKRLSGFLSGFENLRYDIHDVCAAEHSGTARYEMHFDQDGTHFCVPGMMWFDISGGVIARRIDCWDSLVYLKQANADADAIAKLL